MEINYDSSGILRDPKMPKNLQSTGNSKNPLNKKRTKRQSHNLILNKEKTKAFKKAHIQASAKYNTKQHQSQYINIRHNSIKFSGNSRFMRNEGTRKNKMRIWGLLLQTTQERKTKFS